MNSWLRVISSVFAVVALVSCRMSVWGQVIHFQEDLSPTATYQAGATHVRQASPTTNFDNFNGLVLGTFGAGVGPVRSLFSFDVSALPDGVTITSVTFSLRIQATDGASSGSANVPLEIRLVDAPFNEATVTWNTQPSHSTLLSTVTANPTLVNTGSMLAWPSTAAFVSAAQAAADTNGTLYFLARADEVTEAAAAREVFFPDDDDTSPSTPSFHPRLSVTFTAVPEVKGLVLVAAGGAGCLCWRRRRGAAPRPARGVDPARTALNAAEAPGPVPRPELS